MCTRRGGALADRDAAVRRHVHDNDLSGTIPCGLGQLTSLQYLSVSPDADAAPPDARALRPGTCAEIDWSGRCRQKWDFGVGCWICKLVPTHNFLIVTPGGSRFANGNALNGTIPSQLGLVSTLEKL